jgi:hypothetical protein
MDTGGDGERAAHRRVRRSMMPDVRRSAVASSGMLPHVELGVPDLTRAERPLVADRQR